MKLLLDTCVWGGACQELESAGHDVVWTGTWASDPGDEEILAYAHRIQQQYPRLSDLDIRAALAYAADVIQHDILLPLPM